MAFYIGTYCSTEGNCTIQTEEPQGTLATTQSVEEPTVKLTTHSYTEGTDKLNDPSTQPTTERQNDNTFSVSTNEDFSTITVTSESITGKQFQFLLIEMR